MISGLAGSLVLGGCGDNRGYQDFGRFVIKEGNLDPNGENQLIFSKDNKEYSCKYSIINNQVSIFVSYGKIKEFFLDRDLDGLDSYSLKFEDGTLIEDFSSQHKENEKKYDSLIINLPKLYEKSEKQLTELEKFNQDNQKVYENFSKFLKINKNKKMDDKNLYHIGEKIDFVEENGKINVLEVQIDKTTFSDDGLDGLDRLDHLFKEKESGLIETILIKNLSQEKQLQVAQEYTNNLIKIMGKTKDKGNYKKKFGEEQKTGNFLTPKDDGKTSSTSKEGSQTKEEPITKEDIAKVEKEIWDEFKIKKGIQDEFNKQPK